LRIENKEQCLQAAQTLANRHIITFVPTLPEEAIMLPADIVGHFTTFVGARTMKLVELR